jgi:hypothetical protein
VRSAHLFLAILLAGCQLYATPPVAACPGSQVGAFSFDLSESSDSSDGGASRCPFAYNATASFNATLVWDPEGSSAALCAQKPHAVPHTGTHDGDHLTVSVVDEGGIVSTSGCSCPVSVVEVIDGVVLRDDGGLAVGFDGGMLDQLTLAGGGDGGACSCGLPCQIRYRLTGRP